MEPGSKRSQHGIEEFDERGFGKCMISFLIPPSHGFPYLTASRHSKINRCLFSWMPFQVGLGRPLVERRIWRHIRLLPHVTVLPMIIRACFCLNNIIPLDRAWKLPPAVFLLLQRKNLIVLALTILQTWKLST